MDLVLSAADYYVFTPYVYPATWPEDDFFRQTISLLIITNLGAYILYFVFATLSYYFVFDHSLMKHPQFLKNQVYREIMFTVRSLPWISIPTVSLFLLELRGYSKLYSDAGGFQHGWLQLVVSVLSFLFFTDMLIYWIHRGLHHRLIYKAARAQTPPCLEGPYPVREPCFPPRGRLPAEPALPHIPLCLPLTQGGLFRSVHLSEYLDNFHSRW
uniref:Sterol-C5-desaturase n=1 Tax=Molossus molossus TaxID=27622 RepID=A0A7J8BZL7_MOLMO|nr:sterol-C5-desaturase [Molossus molossus]